MKKFFEKRFVSWSPRAYDCRDVEYEHSASRLSL